MTERDWDEEIERLRTKSAIDKNTVRVPEKIWRAMLLSHKDTMMVRGDIRHIIGKKIGPGVWELSLAKKGGISKQEKRLAKMSKFRKTKYGLPICPFIIWKSEEYEQTEFDVSLVFCYHPDNKNDNEGNCQEEFCPLIQTVSSTEQK